MLNPANTAPDLYECPHRATQDPIVVLALDAYTHWSRGQLEAYEPDPGPKLMEAIQCVHASVEGYKHESIESGRRKAEAKARQNERGRTREP